MAKSNAEIIAAFNEYMRKFNYKNSEWYVGIASDPRRRLFTEHNVDEKNGPRICEEAQSEANARAIEKAYVDSGYDGGGGGGDASSVYVYAYAMLPGTVR